MIQRIAIGAMFTEDLGQVLLVERAHHAKDGYLLHFPGGCIKEHSTPRAGISIEFRKESGMPTVPEDWLHVARLSHNAGHNTEFFTAVCTRRKMKLAQDLFNEKARWCCCHQLPDNISRDIHWLLPFARHVWHEEVERPVFAIVHV